MVIGLQQPLPRERLLLRFGHLLIAPTGPAASSSFSHLSDFRRVSFEEIRPY